MSDTQMMAQAYGLLIERLKQEKRLPTLVAPEHPKAIRRCTVIDYGVDLEQAFKLAKDSNAVSLEVFADILRIPVGFARILGGGVSLLSVVARRVIVEGTGADILLAHAELPPDAQEGASRAQVVLRILTEEVVGELLVAAVGHAVRGVKLQASAPAGPLAFVSYTRDKDGLVKNEGKLPLAMLDVGQPLYQLITGSFDLAAGAMRDSMVSPEQGAVGRSILKWLVRWSAYPTPYLARLFDDAEALGRVAPAWGENAQLTHQIPPRTAKEYLDLAGSHMAVAKKYELDENFDNVRDEIKELAARLVQAWIERDAADLGALDAEIAAAKEIVAESKKAVERALKLVDDQKFAVTIAGIDFETTLAKDRIITIVKQTFQIVMDVIKLGVAVAGAAANPGAVGAIPTLGTLGNPFWLFVDPDMDAIPFAAKIIPTMQEILRLWYGLPLEFISNLWNMSATDKEALGKNLALGGPAVFGLYTAAIKLGTINAPLAIAEEIGDLVSTTVSVPDAVESKAVWDAFEVEAVNQLRAIIDDPDANQSIRTAALSYTTVVQKYAIYCRTFSEQQALLAQRVRELGVLLIRKSAAEQKRTALANVRDKLTDRDQLVEMLRLLRNARLRELQQTFFVALSKYRAAYFYRNLDWPAKMPAIVVPRNAGEMAEILDDVARAVAGARPDPAGDFKVVKEINKRDEPKFFADLVANNEARFRIDTADSDLFVGDSLVRISRMRAWLVWLADGAQTVVTAELSSETGLRDRLPNGKAIAFSGDPFFVSFEYQGKDIRFDPLIEGVCPTPFTTWTLNVKGKGLDLQREERIRIEMIGKSVRVRR
jgi:hypothetical protein